jgi:TfoX/Sxy family transcriptional regulator of competence genes
VAYDEALAGRVRDLLASEPDVEEKKMFGGITFMVRGQMCCGVLKQDLVVKVETEGWDALLAQPGVRPFDFSGRPMVGMVYVAGSALETEAELQGWVRRGVDYVSAHPKTAKRGRARK